MKTELNDRILWNDGTNQVAPEKVPELFLHGVPQEKIVVTALNEDIEKFNLFSDEPIVMKKEGNNPFDFTWNIPKYYATLNLQEYVVAQLIESHPDKAVNPAYMNRIKLEMVEISDRKIEQLFKTLIYIVDQLTQQQKVWGVGRGSSCASLVLYLIGAHEVDPIKFNIPLTEFFHD